VERSLSDGETGRCRESPGFVIFAVVSFDVIEGVGARLIPPRARRVRVPPGRHKAWLGDAT
jgi:hypothetical protein